MTGAKMPKGSDTVMRFEDCVVEGEFVKAPAKLKKGEATALKAKRQRLVKFC